MPKPKSDLKRVQNMSEEEIERLALEDPDNPPMTDEEMKKAKSYKSLEEFLPTTKQKVCLRLDRDVLDWFKREGSGYQSKINAALRSFIEAQNHQ